MSKAERMSEMRWEITNWGILRRLFWSMRQPAGAYRGPLLGWLVFFFFNTRLLGVAVGLGTFCALVVTGGTLVRPGPGRVSTAGGVGVGLV